MKGEIMTADQMPDEIYVERSGNIGDYGLKFTPDNRQQRYIRADLATPPKSQGVDNLALLASDQVICWLEKEIYSAPENVMQAFDILVKSATHQHPDKRVEGLVEALELAQKYIQEVQKHFGDLKYDHLAPMTKGNGLYLDAGLKLHHIDAALSKSGAA